MNSPFNSSSAHSPSTALFPYEEMVLDNGLKVVAIPRLNQARDGIAHVNVFYKVGSRNETLGKSGLAHMLEHMSFKSTKHLRAGEIDEIVKRLGGYTNAATGFDYTRYYIEINAAHVEKSLSLFSELMENLNLKDEEFQPERSVVVEERRLRTDNSPSGYLFFRLFNLAYCKHPYHWTPIGFMEDLLNFEINDLKDFYERFYSPSNAIVLVSGDISAAQIFTLSKKHFGHLSNRAVVNDDVGREVDGDGHKFLDIRRDNQEGEMYALAYKIPPFDDLAQVYLSAISSILSDGKSSLLYSKLVEKEKLASDISAFNMELKDEGLFIFFATANPGVSAEEIDASIKEIINDLKNGFFSESFLEKIKFNLKASLIFSLEKASKIASLYGSYFVRGNISPLLSKEADFAKITKENVMETAQKYFILNNQTTIFLRK